MQADIPQGTVFRVTFKVYLNDHLTPATLKTVAVTISKNGAAFGNPSAGATNATEVANGWYYADLSTTDTGTLGPLIFLGTCTGCDNADQAYMVKAVAADPWATTIPGAYAAGTAGHRLGNIPDVAAGASGGLLIAGSNAATTFATLTSTGVFSVNGVTAVAQTGDSFARIGATGSGLTSLAPASTALSTATWTATLAGYIGNLSAGPVALHTDITALSTQVGTPMQAGSSVVLASNGLDSIAIETSINARQSLALIGAATAGASSGVAAGSPVYKSMGGSTTRITATASNGDRSSVTLSPPA